jgi:hypothetical protein
MLLSGYIKRDDTNPSVFRGLTDFNDDEFSDNDIALLHIITDFAKNKSAFTLVEHTHSQNSLWRKSAIQNGVLELLENELINSTEFTIYFSLLFENNPHLMAQFEEVKENLEFVRHLKS